MNGNGRRDKGTLRIHKEDDNKDKNNSFKRVILVAHQKVQHLPQLATG